MDEHQPQRILIFLPRAAAALVAGRLTDAGYLATIACSVPDLRNALAGADFCLVVTTRPDIDIVRDIKPLPVINLEIFFHPDPPGAAAPIGTRQFDAKAFLHRVKALSEPAKPREKPAVVVTEASTAGHGHWLRRLVRLRPLRNAARLSS